MATIDEDLRLAPFPEGCGVLMERRALPQTDGLSSLWLTLDNPTSANAYTAEMLRALVLGVGEADDDPNVVALVLTGAGSRVFCSGGDIAHYAERYRGRPQLMARYMRLFGQVITALLHCAKPTINRVNGARVGGGQELGMACDFSLASDLAIFAQGGLKLGSAQEGGVTDFLPLAVGVEAAIAGCTVDSPWSAYKALRLGLIGDVVPVLRSDGELIRNPLVHTDDWLADGRIIYGEGKTGAALAEAKAVLRHGEVDLGGLDQRVDQQLDKLVGLMPQTTEKALLSLRMAKITAWSAHRDANRLWMAAQMTSEASLGFERFASGNKNDRFIDHAALRRALADGEAWSADLMRELLA
jgi:6-oxo-cyclohex-1-ene-carbonyl-CoA hydrolase